MMVNVRALEFYSGIGGLGLALSRSISDSVVVQAFDWDQTACQVYAANHPGTVRKVDISTLSSNELASFNADLWLLSPSCQPYTVLNPNAKGSADPRAKSFLHLMQTVLPQVVALNALPSRLLIENVAGFELSTTRQVTLSILQGLGYATLELLLTPLQFGIPNSRLRYYLLAKKSPLSFSRISSANVNSVLRHIPGNLQTWIDPRFTTVDSSSSDNTSTNVRQVREYTDDSDVTSLHPFTIPDKVLSKWGRLFDIVSPSSRRTCCFTRGYTQLVERAGSIIQMNEELDTTIVFNEFLLAQSEGDTQAVKLLHSLALRYFTPNELLRLFDFDPIYMNSSFIWPGHLSNKTKYRLIGNSVNVRVVQELILYLFDD